MGFSFAHPGRYTTYQGPICAVKCQKIEGNFNLKGQKGNKRFKEWSFQKKNVQDYLQKINENSISINRMRLYPVKC